MKTSIGFRLSAVICAAILFVGGLEKAANGVPPKQGAVIPPSTGETGQTKTTNGLNTVTFDTLQGRVIVNLPDDMRAGDTISGTVIAEPKGQTKEEQAKNLGVLRGLVVEIDNKRVEPFAGNPEKEREAVIQQTFWIYHVDQPKVNPAPNAAPTSRPVQVSLVNSDGKEIARTTIPTGVISGTPTDAFPYSFNIPPLGQTGRPIVITGPFDGNSSNTTLSGSSALRTSVQDFEKNTATLSGGFRLLAESPRKAVFSGPENVTGPLQITVKEGNTQTTETYRNVGVNLTAPKTSLLKGESTELRVEVNGLQGITRPVPLHLVKGGVVSMQGGDVQTMSIKPAEVQSNGTFTTTRTITGVQAGVWSATATVVVFDVCLQDDNSGNQLSFSSYTGDYIFCESNAKSGTSNAILRTDGVMDFSGGVMVRAGDPGDIKKNGTFTSADFNFKAGHIHAQFDSFMHTGTATVQISNPKRTFTITDRDTRNNTCACK